MEGIIYNPLRSGLGNALVGIEKNRNKVVNFFIFYFLLYPSVFLAHRCSTRALKKTRNMMGLCGVFCENGRCMATAYENAKKARDGFLRIVTKVEKIPYRSKALAVTIVKYNLTEWDDLAEDCLIASDPEIRALASSIAATV
ncbi:MAG: hypothetical protein HN342_14280 [Nitrospina sp.]|jgi:hypothetical protein|nr:hypothetical protein [Nitrospina sp.]